MPAAYEQLNAALWHAGIRMATPPSLGDALQFAVARYKRIGPSIDWGQDDEQKHPRGQEGTERGGQFVSKGDTGGAATKTPQKGHNPLASTSVTTDTLPTPEPTIKPTVMKLGGQDYEVAQQNGQWLARPAGAAWADWQPISNEAIAQTRRQTLKQNSQRILEAIKAGPVNGNRLWRSMGIDKDDFLDAFFSLHDAGQIEQDQRTGRIAIKGYVPPKRPAKPKQSRQPAIPIQKKPNQSELSAPVAQPKVIAPKISEEEQRAREEARKKAVADQLQQKLELAAEARRAERAENMKRLTRTAEDYEISPDDLTDAAKEILNVRREQAAQRERAKGDARRATGLTLNDIKAHENTRGGDYSNIKTRGLVFDKAAQALARTYPDVFGNADDPGADHSATLWQLLREGSQPLPSLYDPEILREAASYVRGNRRRQPGDDEEEMASLSDSELEAVPFSKPGRPQRYSLAKLIQAEWSGRRRFTYQHYANKSYRGQKSFTWVEDDHPREPSGTSEGGQFASKSGESAEQPKPKESLLQPKLIDIAHKFETARKRMVEDFGEKIGGARKDTARKLGPKGKKTNTDDRPAWARRYEIGQITSSSRPEENDKWSIHDTKNKDWTGQPRQIGGLYESKEEAEAAVPLAEVARTHMVTSVGTGENRYVIARKVSDRKRPVVKGGFASYEDAKAYMAAHPVEIIEHEFPRYETFQYLDHVEREGGKTRKGDISPKDFHETFGFRGGEFGNWQSGQSGQIALNHAYDALGDLADMLGMPPAAVALNGTLAIAFGARGTGGKDAARAHYEPDKAVINLTKMKGAGTLAHEWSHAFDHYFGDMAHPEKPAGSQNASERLGPTAKIRPELREAWKNLIDTMTSKEIESPIDKTIAEHNADRSRNYVEERIKQIEEGLKPSTYRKVKPFTPDQQKQWDEAKAKISAGDVGESFWKEGKSASRLSMAGFHTFEPLQKMNELYKAATGRSFHTSDKNSSGRDLYWSIQRAIDAKKRIEQADKGEKQNRRTATDFFAAARRMDETRASEYYTVPTEMLSRAFEAYVYDKLADAGRKSDYLVARAENKFYAFYGLEPFPEGDERKKIAAAFDRLLAEVKHESRSDAKGQHVRMYARGAA